MHVIYHIRCRYIKTDLLLEGGINYAQKQIDAQTE